jgi:hypothetical protein
MFIYCFYRHVNHLNGNYVMKISGGESSLRGEWVRMIELIFSSPARKKGTRDRRRRSEKQASKTVKGGEAKRFELSTTCDYMQIYRFPFRNGGRPCLLKLFFRHEGFPRGRESENGNLFARKAPFDPLQNEMGREMMTDLLSLGAKSTEAMGQ